MFTLDMPQTLWHDLRKLLIKLRSGESLQKRIARGGMWLVGANGAEQALRLLRNMILARLLAPEAFGIMAAIMAAASFLLWRHLQR